MKRLLLSKAGMTALCIVTLVMAFMLHRIASRAREREGTQQAPHNGNSERKAPRSASEAPRLQMTDRRQAAVEHDGGENGQAPVPANGALTRPDPTQDASNEIGAATGFGTALQENLSFMDQGRALGSQSRKDRDRQGRTQIRRRTAGGVGEGQSVSEPREKKATSLQLRLTGKGRKTERSPARDKGEDADPEGSPGAGIDEPEPHPEGDSPSRDDAGNRRGTTVAARALRGDAANGSENLNTSARDGGLAEERFCPYGRPIRCELVFTIDSTMEETPLVALVMEPVYNNGQLVIPAGAELHGMARPDRLRDRIFSSSEWVLLFPREEGLPNGRELRVKGLALDRAEPAADGLSWGITDGSNGLQGMVIRTLESEELKRFAAGFISAAALGLQEREAAGRNGSRTSNTPGNAALQGVAATMEDMARRISTEIERHGVFLRVPGGKQFYFYPQQAIHPWRAAVPRPPGQAPEGG